MERTTRNSTIHHSNNTKSSFYQSVRIPGESANTQTGHNQGGIDTSMVLRTQTTNLGSTGTPQFGQNRQPPQTQNSALRHNRSTNFEGNMPFKRQISFMNKSRGSTQPSQQSGFNPVQQPFSAAQFQQRAYSTQSNGMPPLFVGFLTNEASLHHVQFMLDHYTKTAQKKKGEDKKGGLRAKMDRSLRKKRGKFDARFITSSEEPESSMVEEVHIRKTKKRTERMLGKRHRAERRANTQGVE